MTTPFDVDAFVAELHSLAQTGGGTPHSSNGATNTTDQCIASSLDSSDDLAPLRAEYSLPTLHDVIASHQGDVGQNGKRPSDGISVDATNKETALYLCGNSLGPLSKRSRLYVQQELDAWGRKAVLGHWDHPFGRPWVSCEERVSRLMSDVVGAKPNEVVAMGTLTSNLHVMLATFYRPDALPNLVLPSSRSSSSKQEASGQATSSKKRHKIIYEGLAFPSDQYALASVVALAGFDPRTSLIPLMGRDASHERILRTEDIIQVLEREAATGELAMILLGDIQYQTGQMFDMPAITKRARDLNIIVGWDLAHAFANAPLALHDWDVDFAVWCTYKYGCSGPGGIGGVFLHERWGDVGFHTSIGRDASVADPNVPTKPGAHGLPRPAGWWGHEQSTRFSMPDSFSSIRGAAGWQQSNPSAFDMASMLGALETMAIAPQLAGQGRRAENGSKATITGAQESLATMLASDEYCKQRDAQSGQIGYGHIMPVLRQKSQRLTSYLEHLLCEPGFLPQGTQVSVVTPREARFRGSQLSVRIAEDTSARSGIASQTQPKTSKGEISSPSVAPPMAKESLVSRVHHALESRYGVVCDIRRPDILRLAPVAQFSTFTDVWRAADALRKALKEELSQS